MSLAKYNINLGSLPPFRSFAESWRDLTVANLAVRREAKSLLFHEIAVATRQGVPIADALGLVSQTWCERQTEESTGDRLGADTRAMDGWITTVIICLSMCISAGLFLFLFLSPNSADPERVARIFALRLEKSIRKGIPLSEAMRRFPMDYSREEVGLIQVAEAAGRVPDGLRRLADFQIVSSSQGRASSSLAYPLFVGFITFHLMIFILFKIFPKFQDIFMQMGAELPFVTQAVVSASYIISHSLLLLPLLVGAVALMILRSLLNGNSFTRVFLCFVVVTAVFMFLTGLFAGFLIQFDAFARPSMPRSFQHMSDALNRLVGVAAALVACFFLFPLVIRIVRHVESLVVLCERVIGFLFSYIPFIRSVARAERHARWLGALSMLLETEATEAVALRHAGEIGGRRFAHRSEVAAGLVERGLSLPEAVERARILPAALAARTAFALSGRDLPIRLREIADEEGTFAVEEGTRVARMAEILGILLIGLIAFVMILSVYLPIFTIPQLVGFSLE